jgi:tight adherence protein B
MRPPPLPLLLAGAVLLLLCLGALLLLGRMKTAAETTARAAAVLGPYRRGGTEPIRPDLAGKMLERLSLRGVVAWMARVFGIDIRRRADYPVHWWIVLAGALGAARAAGWLIALLAPVPQLAPVPVLWVLFSRAVFGFFDDRRRDLLFRQFPDALAMVVRALRVGQTVTQALRGLARDAPYPTAVGFVRLTDRLAIGAPLSETLTELANDSGLTEYRFFSTTLLLQSQTGGSVTEPLDTLAEVIRGRVALRRRAHAMAGEARASAILLAVMPVVTFVSLLMVAPDYANVLLNDTVGRRLLGIGIGMLLVGGAIMLGMIKGAVR